ncbi:hypothetical protein R6Q59_018439 [Mikania micrantha]
MNTATTIHHLFAILTVVLTSPASTGQETPAPSSPVPGGCADSVISFSPCLPYISSPPNDLSDEPSSQCCDIFNAAFDSDEAECLCYLVRQNTLLGFPLNVTRLMSLSDICSIKNDSQANDTTTNSLESICSGSPTLPPLITTPKAPPSGSNVRRPPPPPRPTLHHPPPSPTTKPRPPTPPTQNIPKPSASDLELTNAAYIWYFLFEFLYFRI